MEKALLFVTYDFIKEGYPTIPYSIAVLWAAIKSREEFKDIKIKHYSVSLSEYFRDFTGNRERVLEKVKVENQFIVDHYKDIYGHIAIGVNAWSRLYAKDLLDKLVYEKYNGVTILGGYDITATNDSDLKTVFPNASFYIKGYAENPIISILKQDFNDNIKGEVIKGYADPSLIKSPYQHKIISPTRKAYLETKRGCPHRCGFCEWGNFEKGKVVFFNREMVKKDLEILSSFGVEEINVLDGTFNIKKNEYNYVDILNDMLSLTRSHITLQCRFEDINDDEDSIRFLDLCSKNNDRVSLEFGLQTIHEDEMNVIKRKNIMSDIEKAIKIINEKNIKYLISIIYGIPYQTNESFLSTINWIFQHKCLNICPYPLRIPMNSEMYKKIKDYAVIEDYNENSVKIVKATKSFGFSEHDEMTRISDLLFKLQYEYDSLNPDEPLIFIDFSYSNEEAKVSRISSENWLTLNKEFLFNILCHHISLFNQDHFFTVKEMFENKASFEELMPYYKNPVHIKTLLHQIEQISNLTDRFWRILVRERKNIHLQSTILIKYEEFKSFDTELLDMLFIIGAWLYKEPENDCFNVQWFVSNEGIIVVQKIYGGLRLV